MSTVVAPGALVAGLDGSPQSWAALDWAIDLAQLEKRAIHLVHAHGTTPDSASQGEALLQSAVHRVHAMDPGLRVSSTNAAEPGRSALLGASAQAALLVVGAHGRGHPATGRLGSTTLAVVGAAACPVAVIRPAALNREHVRRVVVGVDESAGCHDAIGFAFAQADLRRLRLTAVHAWHASDRIGLRGAITPPHLWRTSVGNEEAAMAESLAGWGEKYPDVELHRVSIRKESSAAILTTAGDADLVVLGSRPAGPRSETIGSPTVRKVLRSAACPVAVVPEGSL